MLGDYTQIVRFIYSAGAGGAQCVAEPLAGVPTLHPSSFGAYTAGDGELDAGAFIQVEALCFSTACGRAG